MKNMMAHKHLPYLIEFAEEVCRAADSPTYVIDFIGRYLTPSELAALAIRWQIIERVLRGDTMRAIAHDLHVSTATVARWSLEEWRWRWEA